jgi:hypothetical protein
MDETLAAVAESYRREILEPRVTLELIRGRIGETCRERYAPNPAFLLGLLYPNSEDVQREAERRFEEEESEST